MFFGQYDSIPAEEELPFDPTEICEYPDLTDTAEADQELPEWLRDDNWEAAK